MSNDVTTSDGGAPMTPSTSKRRALWVATGVAGLTGVVGLAALGGLAARDDKSNDPQRVAENHAAVPQNASDAGPDGDKGDRSDDRAKAEQDKRDVKDGDEWGEHGRVREVPCDEEELIEAVDLANRDHGGTLKLAERCTYELSFADKKSGTGLPTIKQDITIKGNDSTIKRDSEDGFRIFRVADGGELTLKDLTVKDGNASEFKYGGAPNGAPGGAPAVHGSAPAVNGSAPAGMDGAAVAPDGTNLQAAPAAPAGPIDSAAPTGSASGSPSSGGGKGKEDGEGDGGALLVERGGSAHLKNVKLTGNNAENNGGAIASFGRVDLEDSKVENNHAGKDGGGVFNEGVLKVKDTQFLNNTAGANGGAIANGTGKGTEHGSTVWLKGRDEAGTVEILGSFEGKDGKDENRSLIEGNSADGNGGGIFSSGGFVKLTFTTVKNNTACENGGGIYAEDTDLKLEKVTVAKNHAEDNGGGIVNTGGKHWDWPSDDEHKATATISDSWIVDNTAGRFGGGIFNGEWLVKVEEGYQEKKDGKDDNALLTLRDTEIKGNTALNGGGIFNNKGTVTLNDTRVTKNTATDSSKNHRVAGGILNNEGRVRLDDKSTVTNNDPTNCAGTVKDCFN